MGFLCFMGDSIGLGTGFSWVSLSVVIAGFLSVVTFRGAPECRPSPAGLGTGFFRLIVTDDFAVGFACFMGKVCICFGVILAVESVLMVSGFTRLICTLEVYVFVLGLGTGLTLRTIVLGLGIGLTLGITVLSIGVGLHGSTPSGTLGGSRVGLFGRCLIWVSVNGLNSKSSARLLSCGISISLSIPLVKKNVFSSERTPDIVSLTIPLVSDFFFKSKFTPDFPDIISLTIPLV